MTDKDANYWFSLSQIAFACYKSAYSRGDERALRRASSLHKKYAQRFNAERRKEERAQK